MINQTKDKITYTHLVHLDNYYCIKTLMFLKVKTVSPKVVHLRLNVRYDSEYLFRAFEFLVCDNLPIVNPTFKYNAFLLNS